MWYTIIADSRPIKAQVLNEIELPIISNGECEEWFRDGGAPGEVPSVMMCAGYKEGGRDSCQVFSTF